MTCRQYISNDIRERKQRNFGTLCGLIIIQNLFLKQKWYSRRLLYLKLSLLYALQIGSNMNVSLLQKMTSWILYQQTSAPSRAPPQNDLNSSTVSLHSPNGRLLPAVMAVHGDCQWLLKNGGNSHRSHEPAIHCDRGNPNLYLDQRIGKGWCQPIEGNVSYNKAMSLAVLLPQAKSVKQSANTYIKASVDYAMRDPSTKSREVSKTRDYVWKCANPPDIWQAYQVPVKFQSDRITLSTSPAVTRVREIWWEDVLRTA